MKKQLNKILNQLDNQDGNPQTLGYEALAVIKETLEENPFDIDTRIIKMRINFNIFENSSAIIEDATFITENDQFKTHKMVGYDWLFWVYKDVLSMPEKAIETIEEQLVEMQSLFDKKYVKDRKESELLDKFAQLKFDNGDKDAALDLWYKAYKKYPYFDNNAFVGMLFLDKGEFDKAEELLLAHYEWSYDYEDGFRLKYGIKLKKLYDAKKLDNHPTLIGLLFNIIRNEEQHFKTTGNLDFFEKYYPELEKWTEKYPNNTLIWGAIGNTHFFDTKNYQKAFEAFSKLMECDNLLEFLDISKIIKAAKKSKNDFFALPFKFEGSSSTMYNSLTTLYDKGKKKKQKKKFVKLAIQYGEVGYNQYRDYLINGKGNTHSNQPHMFAMLCNNYANALGNYADLFLEDEEKDKMYAYAGDIHMEGYEMSPFRENLENAAIDYYRGKSYKNSIKYSLAYFETYKDEINTYDYQYHYRQIVACYIRLDDLQGAEKYYFKAKKLYNKVGQGSKDATFKFIFAAKLFYEFAVREKKEYKKYISEMAWFLAQKVAVDQEPNEHGLVSYYLGKCYKETNQKDKAIKAFQVTVDYMQDADWEFYDTKCEEAEDYIEELGGKVIKKPKKKTSAVKRFFNAIFFPFMVLWLIGGILWDYAMGRFPGQRNDKDEE